MLSASLNKIFPSFLHLKLLTLGSVIHKLRSNAQHDYYKNNDSLAYLYLFAKETYRQTLDSGGSKGEQGPGFP